MLKHNLIQHPDQVVTFSMKIIKKHRTCFARQTHEAVMIEMMDGGNILNSKGGFNRSSIPRLTAMVGDKIKVDDNKSNTEFTRRKRKTETENQAPPKRRNNNHYEEVDPKVLMNKYRKDETSESLEKKVKHSDKTYSQLNKSISLFPIFNLKSKTSTSTSKTSNSISKLKLRSQDKGGKEKKIKNPPKFKSKNIKYFFKTKGPSDTDGRSESEVKRKPG